MTAEWVVAVEMI
jgi:hypothetical protein